MHQWWSKIERVLGTRPNLGSELEQEIEAHIEFLIEKNLERGMAPEDASAAARGEFGNRTWQQDYGARAKLPVVAIFEIRNPASRHWASAARDRQSTGILAHGDCDPGSWDWGKHCHIQCGLRSLAKIAAFSGGRAAGVARQVQCIRPPESV